MVCDPMALLVGGEILNSVMCPYTNLMGLWIYAIGVLVFNIFLIGKTENMTMVVVVNMLIIGALAPILPPEVQPFMYIILILGVSGVLYKIFH